MRKILVDKSVSTGTHTRRPLPSLTIINIAYVQDGILFDNLTRLSCGFGEVSCYESDSATIEYINDSSQRLSCSVVSLSFKLRNPLIS